MKYSSAFIRLKKKKKKGRGESGEGEATMNLLLKAAINFQKRTFLSDLVIF